LIKPGSSFLSAIDKKGQVYVICHAIGHLYGLTDSSEKNKVFPVFNPIWAPLSASQQNTKQQPNSKFLKYKIDKILREISDLSKNASSYIHACDYDQEGEVIGYNILHFACHQKYGVSRRAKFSSLTDEEITKSFENLLPPNHKLKDSGISRHTIDFIYGINFSRALTDSIKQFSNQRKGKFIQMSIGRVQGPTLAFVVERENEILNHIPVPYWNIIADFVKENNGGRTNGIEESGSNDTKRNNKGINIIQTSYFPQRIDSKDTAIKIKEDCQYQIGNVTFAKTIKSSIKPLYPFNLGDLQREAFKLFRFTPSYTLSVAEKLYLAALISYPRTSSQKLPPTINYKEIINKISKFESGSAFSSQNENIGTNRSKLSYSEISRKLLTQVTGTTSNLHPNEGKEIDPAHPAIYPTGEKPNKKNLDQSDLKLLDLIIRRFFCTFGADASVNQTSLNITVREKHLFKTEEKKIVFKGWIEFYDPYFDYTSFVSKEILSYLKVSDRVRNIEVKVSEKTTQPPPRYNQSTLLQKMEREKIGTKATRSEIINTLFKRNYIYNHSSQDKVSDNVNSQLGTAAPIEAPKSSVKTKASEINPMLSNNIYQRSGIRPTQLGITLINSMHKYVPNIISPGLTRSMEEQLSKIESGENSSDTVIKQAQGMVKNALQLFLQNQKEIAKEIFESINNDYEAQNIKSKARTIILGYCPVCSNGNLIVKRSAKSKKRFAGCSNYATKKCTATASLPLKGTVKGTGKKCDECNWPLVSATGINEGKKYQWRMCINKDCPLKKGKEGNT